jgi:hypothetical protein
MAPPTSAAAPPSNQQIEQELADRALSNPEVRRFQEAFPESQVRTIRNLRD